MATHSEQKIDTTKLDFELVSPEARLLSEFVTMVVVPCSGGERGILAHHAPLITSVEAGVARVYQGGQTEAHVTERIFVSGGFLEISNNTATLLAEEAIPVADLNRATLEKTLADLTEDLQDSQNPHDQHHLNDKILVISEKLKHAAA